MYIVTSSYFLNPNSASWTFAKIVLFHFFFILCLDTLSFMFEHCTSSTMSLFTGWTFSLFEKNKSRTILFLAANVLGILLQKSIFLKLFDLLKCLFIEHFVYRERLVKKSSTTLLETTSRWKTISLWIYVGKRAILTELMRTLSNRVQIRVWLLANNAKLFF